MTFLKNGINLLGRLAHIDAIAFLLSFMAGSTFAGTALDTLVQVCRAKPDVTSEIASVVCQSLPHPSADLVGLLCNVCNIGDKFAG
jgi:hypothetical protein